MLEYALMQSMLDYWIWAVDDNLASRGAEELQPKQNGKTNSNLPWPPHPSYFRKHLKLQNVCETLCTSSLDLVIIVAVLSKRGQTDPELSERGRSERERETGAHAHCGPTTQEARSKSARGILCNLCSTGPL